MELRIDAPFAETLKQKVEYSDFCLKKFKLSRGQCESGKPLLFLLLLHLRELGGGGIVVAAPPQSPKISENAAKKQKFVPV